MKILWLTRDLYSNDALFLQKKYKMTLSDDYKIINKEFDIVIVSNYDKVVPEEYFDYPKKGIVVIHSSDLPYGKGWAPIYNSIVNSEGEYVVSLIKIDKNVDSGNILLKIRINKPKYITNTNLRSIDEEAIIELTQRFLRKINNIDKLVGIEQNTHESTYYKKRAPEDNKLDLEDSLKNQLLNILATNSNYPSFVEIDGTIIEITAKIKKEYKLRDLSFNFEDYLL